MKYRVLYTQSVTDDISAQVRYLRERRVSDEVIEVWFSRLFDFADSLNEWPARFPVAEPETARKGFKIRKAVFGDYLLFYRIDEGRRLVELLSFQHGARRRER